VDAEVVRRRVVARGVVQGVGYRYSLLRLAEEHGVAGWVRNRGDGAVEAVFEGPRPAVDSLVAWFRHGPRGAEVIGVESFDEQPEGLRGFRIAR